MASNLSRFVLSILHFDLFQLIVVKSAAMAAKQMEEIQKKLTILNYPRANAPAQSLLFAGMERYALLEWLFFRFIL